MPEKLIPDPEKSKLPKFGIVKNTSELGALIRAHRKSHHWTLEKISGLTNVSMRFLSELERGKETARLGMALTMLQRLGLEIIIQPRGDDLYQRKRDDELAEEEE